MDLRGAVGTARGGLGYRTRDRLVFDQADVFFSEWCSTASAFPRSILIRSSRLVLCRWYELPFRGLMRPCEVLCSELGF